jgi:hypothetical protein
MLPKREIPILHYRDIGTYQGQHCTYDKNNAGRDTSSELTPEAVIGQN